MKAIRKLLFITLSICCGFGCLMVVFASLESRLSATAINVFEITGAITGFVAFCLIANFVTQSDFFMTYKAMQDAIEKTAVMNNLARQQYLMYRARLEELDKPNLQQISFEGKTPEEIKQEPTVKKPIL